MDNASRRLDSIIHTDLLAGDSDDKADQGSRSIALATEISTESVFPLIKRLLSFNKFDHAPIHFFISSPGGDVFSGLALVDTMLHIESPVFTYCIGLCASMAAIVLAAGEPKHRYILPHSRVMIHQGFGRAAGKMEDLKSTIGLQASLESDANRLLAAFTGKSVRAIRHASRTDKWMAAEQARCFGLLDHVLTQAPGRRLSTASDSPREP